MSKIPAEFEEIPRLAAKKQIAENSKKHIAENKTPYNADQVFKIIEIRMTFIAKLELE
jgi:hypothetical protein